MLSPQRAVPFWRLHKETDTPVFLIGSIPSPSQPISIRHQLRTKKYLLPSVFNYCWVTWIQYKGQQKLPVRYKTIVAQRAWSDQMERSRDLVVWKCKVLGWHASTGRPLVCGGSGAAGWALLVIPSYLIQVNYKFRGSNKLTATDALSYLEIQSVL